ncbi:hypothetical protein QUB63_04340 [Microcoleus sp. ARI1-B5]|uniref:hypothetical protein n=1 Tax=unclassified Microcoleus TaxID=2642155 RepID=UPI002FD451BF
MNSLILISPSKAWGFQSILSGKSWPTTSIAPCTPISLGPLREAFSNGSYPVGNPPFIVNFCKVSAIFA